jgi:heptosyltransferase-1
VKVLIIKTSSLGDVVHTLPALTDAAANVQDIQFDWVVEEGFAQVPSWHATVNNVIPVALRRWRKHPLKARASGEWARFKRDIRATDYDAVIDAQGLLKSAWLCRYTRGERYGLDKQSAREPLASRFYQHKIHVPKGQHAVERTRQLFAAALGYAVPDTLGEYQIDRQRLPQSSHQGDYLLFCHGTTWPTKHWPEAYWCELARLLASSGLKILLPWGNDVECQRAQRIAETGPHVEVLPRSTLSQLASIIGEARAVVSVDTGLAHLTAAMATPNITLYGPTDPGLVGTYGAHQSHLLAKNYPTQKDAGVEPQVFAPLTPDIVFAQLNERLALERRR